MRLMMLVLALLGLANAWFPPCKTNLSSPGENGVDAFAVRFIDACDVWQAPHLTNPMLLMVWTQSPLWAFFISGAFEILENLAVIILRSYVVFIGVTAVGFENIPDILLSDWAIQAGLGIALGQVLIWFFRPPVLWRGWYTDRGRWVWYAFWYLVTILTQIPYAYYPTGPFPLGPNLTITMVCIAFALLIHTEPRKAATWATRSDSQRADFWTGFVAVYVSFMLVVQYDFLIGSAVQTWALTVVWILLFFVFALIQGRWNNMLRWCDWSGRYLRRRAKILKARALAQPAELDEDDYDRI